MHLGFDRSRYPGDAVMRSIRRATPLAFVGIYLAPAPSHPDTGWMNKVPLLREIGWGFLPVYVGQQSRTGPGSHVLTREQALRDAVDAGRLAEKAELDPCSVLYLDIEQGGRLTLDHLSYVGTWVGGIAHETAYRPGVYCSYRDTADHVAAETGDVPTWVFHVRDTGPALVDLATEEPPDPAESGFPGAVAWQYRMSLSGAVDLRWQDDDGLTRTLHEVDLSSAVCRDPSQVAVVRDR
ncbi:MAG: glycoside hydrolase domain-containing protein [Micromonosporaceae bacterium]